MLTGRKQLPDQITPPRVTSLVLAGVVLGGSAAAVALLATFRVRRDEGALVAGSNGRKPLAQASRELKKATLRPKITQN